jgi:hypothetical protein
LAARYSFPNLNGIFSTLEKLIALPGFSAIYEIMVAKFIVRSIRRKPPTSTFAPRTLQYPLAEEKNHGTNATEELFPTR